MDTAEAPETNPFRAPRFPRWWLASLFAGTGLGIQAVTVPIFIRDRVPEDDRAIAIAAVLVAQTLPGAALALLGGAMADRVERRRILVRTYAVVAVVSCCYVALAGLDVRVIWPVFPLAAAVGCAGAFTNPARQSMLPQILARSQLQNGVIFGTMGFMATLQFLGPSVGGLATDAAGLAAAFGIEVLLLAGAALAFFGVHTPSAAPSGRSLVSELAEGVRYGLANRTVRGLLILSLVPGTLFIGPFAVTIPITVPDIFQAEDKWVGLLWGCFGGGVFAGSVLLTLHPLPRRGLAVLLANLSGGLVLAVYGLADTLPVAAGLLVVWGLGASVFINFVVALLQEQAEPRMMGRVMSMYSLMFMLSMPLGYAQAGLVTNAFGPRTTLVASGVAACVVAVLSLAGLRSVRALR